MRHRWRRRGVTLAAIAATAGLCVLVVASPASAAISGPCSASIAGSPVSGLGVGATDEPVTVQKDSAIAFSMAAHSTMTHYAIALEFGGFSWTVKDRDIKSQSWSDSVSVNHYAKYGVGLYKASGTSVGPGLSCTGAALIKVEGNPLSSTAGQIGLGLAGVGGIGIAGAGMMAMRASRSPRSVGEWAADTLEQQAKADESVSSTQGVDDAADVVAAVYPEQVSGCFMFVLPALLLATGAMIGGGGGGKGSGVGRGLARVRFRPAISIVGLISGLFLGLGGGVLLQQYSVIYPTRTVAILELAVGIVVGLALPMFGRARAVRKMNRAIAGAEEKWAARA